MSESEEKGILVGLSVPVISEEDDTDTVVVNVWFPNKCTKHGVPYYEVCSETGYDSIYSGIDRVIRYLRPGYTFNDAVDTDSIKENVSSDDPRVHIRVIDIFKHEFVVVGRNI